MLPGKNVVFAGMLSITFTASAAVVVLPLVTTIVYSTRAPGIALGFVVKLNGSKTTAAVLASVSAADSVSPGGASLVSGSA